MFLTSLTSFWCILTLFYIFRMFLSSLTSLWDILRLFYIYYLFLTSFWHNDSYNQVGWFKSIVLEYMKVHAVHLGTYICNNFLSIIVRTPFFPLKFMMSLFLFLHSAIFFMLRKFRRIITEKCINRWNGSNLIVIIHIWHLWQILFDIFDRLFLISFWQSFDIFETFCFMIYYLFDHLFVSSFHGISMTLIVVF